MQKIKDKLLKLVTDETFKHLEVAREALSSTKSLMEQDDLKQEGKYDTRRIEAGYLAAAQDKRVQELKQDYNALKNFQFLPQAQKVINGSLVKCLHEGKETHYLILPGGAGIQASINNVKYHILCLSSPTANELLGLEEGDFFEVNTPKGEVEFEVLEIH